MARQAPQPCKDSKNISSVGQPTCACRCACRDSDVRLDANLRFHGVSVPHPREIQPMKQYRPLCPNELQLFSARLANVTILEHVDDCMGNIDPTFRAVNTLFWERRQPPISQCGAFICPLAILAACLFVALADFLVSFVAVLLRACI